MKGLEMVRHIVLNVVMILGLIFTGCGIAVHRDNSGKKITNPGVSLSTGFFVISGDRLSMSYEIQNNSEEDIWFCDDIDVRSPVDFENIATLDGQVLLIRMRLDLPKGWFRGEPPVGRYVQLMPGKTYVGSIWLKCPVRQQPVLASRSAHHPEDVKEASRLILEIGYFSGNLPERMLSLIREAKMAEQEAERLSEEVEGLIDEKRTFLKKAKEERLMEKVNKLSDQIDQLLEGRTVQVGNEVMWLLEEDTNSAHKDDSNMLSLPHSYRRVEAESLLTSMVDKIIPYLPPRYLDFDKELPWGKRRLDKTCIEDEHQELELKVN